MCALDTAACVVRPRRTRRRWRCVDVFLGVRQRRVRKAGRWSRWVPRIHLRRPVSSIEAIASRRIYGTWGMPGTFVSRSSVMDSNGCPEGRYVRSSKWWSREGVVQSDGEPSSSAERRLDNDPLDAQLLLKNGESSAGMWSSCAQWWREW